MEQKRNIHFRAATLFTVLAMLSVSYGQTSSLWPYLTILLTIAVAISLTLGFFIRAKTKSAQADEEVCHPDRVTSLPEGQARLIDSGRLPNRYHPNLDLREYEISHFYVSAQWLIFEPFPSSMHNEWSRALIRYSGDRYYYILRPYEILLPAQPETALSGELIITSQRVVFISPDNGFEIPLERIENLDCSAHLIDFFVKNRRYTIQTDAACYAEKVFTLLSAKDEV